MVKVLSFSFEQCLGTFTMLLLEGSSETGLFETFIKPRFSESVSPKIPLSYDGNLFSEIVQN